MLLKGISLGTNNITVRAETAQSSEACGSATVSDALAKDAIRKSVIVEVNAIQLTIYAFNMNLLSFFL